MHVHVYCADGEAKLWLLPKVAVAGNHGLSQAQLNEVAGIVKDRKDEIAEAWHKYFPG